MAETVTADEATILQDFFAVQADKHGPGIFARLQRVGQGEEERRRGATALLPLLPSPGPGRNVSVIQRTPNIERPDPPKIILQRRVLEIPEHVRQQLLAGVRAEKAAKVAERVEGKVGVKGVEGTGRRGLQKKFPQGQRTNQQQSDHLVCQVCGERAGKHSYYGGQVGHSSLHTLSKA